MLKTYRMLLEMMTPRERKRFWFLVIITMLLSAVEAASVISILPFLQLLADPELVETQPILKYVYDSLGFTSVNRFQVAAGIAVFIVTILGLTMKTLTVWMTIRFSMMRAYSLSARLLTGYLHQPYEWFLMRHSSELGAAILTEVDRVVRQAMLPAMRFVPELFSVVWLVLALCIIEPEIALIGAGLLGGAYICVFVVVRRLLTRLGQIEVKSNRTKFHVVQESTAGVKELKLMGLEGGFLKRFREASYRQAKVQTKTQVIGALPRYALEAIAFGGMILLILVLLIKTDAGLIGLIPTLGLIAATSMRLIPGLQQLYQRVTMVRNSQAVLSKIHKEMTGLNAEEQTKRSAREAIPSRSLTKVLELKNVQYQYPGADRPALNGLDMSISANSTVGIVGGTGAGKTTLIDIMLGLLDPNGGEMVVDGVAVTPDSRRSWQKTLGYVPQTIFLSDATIAENIAFGVPKSEIDVARVEAAAKTAALHDFIMQELPDGYESLVGERGTRLSGGQRQRVGIARALFHDPTTLIFDEATSALDTLTEAAVMEAVHKIAGRKTIIMIAHRLSTVRNCDVIFLLRHGQVAAYGPFDDLVKKDKEFRRMAEDLITTAS